MISGLSLKKTPHMWLLHAKTTFYLDTTHVVAARQNNILFKFRIARHDIMACDVREIEYW